MNTNWKEDIHKAIEVGLSTDYNDQALEQFISTEIIEKLIEDIPNEYERGVVNLPAIKQQLKSKWL